MGHGVHPRPDAVDPDAKGTVKYNLNNPLPTEDLVAKNPGPRKYDTHAGQFNAGAGADGTGVAVQPMHDAEYYTQWRQEKQEQIARGEDPWKEYEQRAKEAHDKTLLGRMSKAFKGKDKDKKEPEADVK